MMYHALRGLGDCISDPSSCGPVDVTDMGTTDINTTNSVDNQLAIQNALNPGGAFSGSSAGGGVSPTGSASSGFNWGIFAPLINAAGAIGSGFAASQLQPGQSLQTSGTTIVGAGQSLPGSVVGGVNLGSLTLPLMIGGGLLLLVVVMSGGKR